MKLVPQIVFVLKRSVQKRSEFLRLSTWGLIILTIYSYPYLATWVTVGFVNLPPKFSPDLYLYLNLSDLKFLAKGLTISPWYGIPVPAVDIDYNRFGLAFQAFRILRYIVGGDLSILVLIWNLLWFTLIWLSGIWFFRAICSEPYWPKLAIGLSLLLLVDLTSLRKAFWAWGQLPSFRGFEDLRLPYIREFFPRVAIPLLLSYSAMQIYGLRGQKWFPWIIMAFIQVLALATFPYLALLMGAITLVIVLVLCFSRKVLLDWRPLVIFGLLCAVSDGVYLLLKGASVLGMDQKSILIFNPIHLSHLIGGTFISILILAVAIFLSKNKSHPEVKLVLFAVGFASSLLLLADVLLSPLLLVSTHIGYFAHTALALLTAYLIFQIYPILSRRFHSLIWIPYSILVALLLHGSVVAYFTFHRAVSFNKEQAELALLINSLRLRESDLIIAPSRNVDDTAAWVPLLTKAKVLFTRNAEFVLPPKEKEKIQRCRLALYLFMSGRDVAWVESTPVTPEGKAQQKFLSLVGEEILLDGPDRERSLYSIKEKLTPFLLKIINHDPEIREFFRRYERILIIDHVHNHLFQPPRISAYLEVVEEKEENSYLLRWCKPL